MKLKLLAFVALCTLTVNAQSYVVSQPEVRTDTPRKDYFATQLLYETVANDTTTGYSAVTYLTDNSAMPYKRLFQEHTYETRIAAQNGLILHLFILRDFYNSKVYKDWNKHNQSHWQKDFSLNSHTQPKFTELLQPGEKAVNVTVKNIRL